MDKKGTTPMEESLYDDLCQYFTENSKKRKNSIINKYIGSVVTRWVVGRVYKMVKGTLCYVTEEEGYFWLSMDRDLEEFECEYCMKHWPEVKVNNQSVNSILFSLYSMADTNGIDVHINHVQPLCEWDDPWELRDLDGAIAKLHVSVTEAFKNLPIRDYFGNGLENMKEYYDTTKNPISINVIRNHVSKRPMMTVTDIMGYLVTMAMNATRFNPLDQHSQNAATILEHYANHDDDNLRNDHVKTTVATILKHFKDFRQKMINQVKNNNNDIDDNNNNNNYINNVNNNSENNYNKKRKSEDQDEYHHLDSMNGTEYSNEYSSFKRPLRFKAVKEMMLHESLVQPFLDEVGSLVQRILILLYTPSRLAPHRKINTITRNLGFLIVIPVYLARALFQSCSWYRKNVTNLYFRTLNKEEDQQELVSLKAKVHNIFMRYYDSSTQIIEDSIRSSDLERNSEDNSVENNHNSPSPTISPQDNPINLHFFKSPFQDLNQSNEKINYQYANNNNNNAQFYSSPTHNSYNVNNNNNLNQSNSSSSDSLNNQYKTIVFGKNNSFDNHLLHFSPQLKSKTTELLNDNSINNSIDINQNNIYNDVEDDDNENNNNIESSQDTNHDEDDDDNETNNNLENSQDNNNNIYNDDEEDDNETNNNIESSQGTNHNNDNEDDDNETNKIENSQDNNNNNNSNDDNEDDDIGTNSMEINNDIDVINDNNNNTQNGHHDYNIEINCNTNNNDDDDDDHNETNNNMEIGQDTNNSNDNETNNNMEISQDTNNEDVGNDDCNNNLENGHQDNNMEIKQNNHENMEIGQDCYTNNIENSPKVENSQQQQQQPKRNGTEYIATILFNMGTAISNLSDKFDILEQRLNSMESRIKDLSK
ncbi:GATA-binding transcription factor [Cavenderia fasciculata]|uniref:GATA-binding transcription factor n=1 Tax=Cavenderia fasciculata TaxID=261658 RepID=F4PLL4_CACFS|nr:GATA-binding transcription factor [Cavenderia fasciculata]EGG23436.1 GATA-binding transcription factor [Cavenderia fasciculata]|eukprot:XP_004361287.1 GATA-binding transcription factor [Cavenderia fasciculata]